MNIGENVTAREVARAVAVARAHFGDDCEIEGVYEVVCRNSEGRIRWRDIFANTVVTVGKNLMLDAALAGSAYTVVGPFMGLISSISFSAISAADTMTSHAGWLEAGATNNPTYTSPRKTAAWSAASAGAKALSAALSFGILVAGTIKGAFLVYGTGALSTIDNTAGTLFSAGLFTGGDRAVLNGDTVQVSYSCAL
jgi:hypothetical protein